MFQSDKPRHTIRAQGKVRIVAPPGDSRTSNSANANVRMLNYLSVNASENEKYLLEQGANASVRTSSAAAGMLETWLNSGGYSVGGEAGNSDELLDETAFEGYWPKANFEDEYDSADVDTTSKVRRRSVERSADRRVPVQNVRRSNQGVEGPEAYLRSLRERNENRSRGKNRAGDGAADDSRELNSGVVSMRLKPRIEIAPEGRGERIETYPNGAKVIKDSLGRVQEIRSEKGIAVALNYDDKGHLTSFTRSDKRGTVHSSAEADRHGVLVRDSRGRVRAQGESMQVDATGCVSITREDGQFWSMDLIRSIHTERRLLPDEHGEWYSMTALFCSDGFRMATRFRKVNVRDDGRSVQVLVCEPEDSSAFIGGDSGSYRFYGRDGSVITFDSDAELHYLKPSSVKGPGSRPVEADKRGKRQAGTAWEALREYVFNYLAAL